MPPRRLLSELCAYYKRTLGAKDVYVEGRSDARIWNQEFIHAGLADVIAYPIDNIEIDTVPRENIPHSNKERVLLVAAHLSGCASPLRGRAVCLVDADADHFHGINRANNVVAVTPLADLLCYFCSTDVLKYSLTHIFGDDADVNAIVNNVIGVCVQLFCARRALERIAPGIGFLDDPSDACSVSKTGTPCLLLSPETLANKILGPPNNRMDLKNALLSAMTEVRPRDDLSSLQQINSHDFVNLLKKILIKRGRSRFPGNTTAQAIEALLYGSQRAAKLSMSPLCAELCTRLNVATPSV